VDAIRNVLREVERLFPFNGLAALLRSLKDSMFLVAQKPSGWQEEICWCLPKLLQSV